MGEGSSTRGTGTDQGRRRVCNFTRRFRAICLRRQHYETIFADLGALTMVDAQVISPTQISVSANAARGGPVTLLVSIQAEPPHRITGIGFERR